MQSELVHLLFVVTELLQDASELALHHHVALGPRDSLCEARWAAHKDVCIVGGRCSELLELVLGDVATLDVSCGGRGGSVVVVDVVNHLETTGVLCPELVELLSEDDVAGRLAAVEERDLCLFVVSGQDVSCELVQGRDTGAAADQGDVFELVAVPLVRWDGASEVHGVAHLEGEQVRGHGPVRVPFDGELDLAALVQVADRRVGPDRGHPVLFTLELHQDRGRERHARSLVCAREIKHKPSRVRSFLSNIAELQRRPSPHAQDVLVAVIRRAQTAVTDGI